jgi:hypothetical protein
LKGDLDDAIFAADFGDLIGGKAPQVYDDAKVFFRNTHPARELCKLAQLVFGRLANKKEPGAVIRLSTGFGGGKTHALIALWHLAQNIQDSSIGTDLLPAAGRPESTTVVGVDVGKAGVPVFAKHGKVQVHSLWGEIAFRLAGEKGIKAIGPADSAEASPPEGVIDSLLPKGPVLFLIDELVIYMARLSERGQSNVLGFLGNLISIFTKRPQSVLVLTDPAGQAVYAKEAAKIAEATAALKDVTGRKATDIEPAKDEEAQIIVRRLFDKVDGTAAEAASAQYHSLYSRIAPEGRVPEDAGSKSYARRIVTCYPFHPRLLDTARGRLAALDSFQKSRGVLRLFARILRDTWDSDEDVTLISAGEIDWSSARIQADLLQRLDRANFKAAIQADIEKHALELDGGSRGIHTRVASALLLESIPLHPNSGLDDPELTLAVVRPDEAGQEPAEALERLQGVCWHLYPMVSGKGFQFRYDQNVLKQVEERKAKISREDAVDRVRAEVQKYFGGHVFKLSSWPANAKQVTDSPQLQLALCETVDRAKAVASYCDDSNPDAPLPRRFRNAILAVSALPNAFDQAVDRAQRLMALEAIEQENKAGEAGKLVREQVSRLKPEFQKQFRLQSCRAFNRVVFSSGTVHQIDEKYQFSDDEVLQQPQGQECLRKFLEDKKMIYGPQDSLDSDRFAKEVLPGTVPVIDQPGVFTAKAVFERFLGAPNLRLVPGEAVVRNTLLKAINDGKIVVRFSDGRAYDSQGCVGGAEGQRRRTNEKVNALPLDEDVLITAAGSSPAEIWLKEDDAKSTKGKPGKGQPPDVWSPKSPVDGPVASSGWDKTIEYAANRPLVELKLRVNTPAEASALIALAPVLGANNLELTVSAGGYLKDGGMMNFMASGVKPTHPAKPLSTAQTVFNALAEGSQYEAELVFNFGEDGRTGMAQQLDQVRQQTPTGTFVVGQFGKVAGAAA